MDDVIEKKLWEKAKKYTRILQLVPFLRMAAVCNNLSFGQVKAESDIDLFIIAKSGRLFIVRTFVTFLLHILGVRRHGNKIAGRFCLTFFIDDKSLNLSPLAISQDIYLSYWVKSIVPLIDDGIGLEFLQANLWARDYFENSADFYLNNSQILKTSGFLRVMRKIFTFILKGKFGNFLERRLMNWQLKRARAKAKNASQEADLIIQENILKFHNIDRRRQYRNVWLKTYGPDSKISVEKFNALRGTSFQRYF